MKSDHDLDLAVLVLSCDKYSHLWPAFFSTFNKYFPDCPCPVYLGANAKSFSSPKVKTLLTGDDPDWSTSLLRILAQIPERRLFIILEDLLLAAPMNTDHFMEAALFLKNSGGNFIRYYLPNPPDEDVPGQPFGRYSRGRPYRMSVVGFWDKSALQSLLIPGENPWNFEILGSYRTSYRDGFFMMKKELCQFTNMIEKGRWYPEALRWAEQEGLEIGADSRPVLKSGSRLKSLLQILYYRIMLCVPWQTRVRWMHHLRRLLISY